MRESFENFFFNQSGDEQRAAIRASLLAIATALFALERRFKVVLGTEARVMWLLAMSYGDEQFEFLPNTIALLDRLSLLETRLNQLGDACKEAESALVLSEINSASAKTGLAIKQVHALIDHVRAETLKGAP